ncbi:hypothetical protein Poli38472_004359 [Pythium oligandrum]|uniref:Enoyl reductase (ER) domain-containing protein n=1 Tax=Pythium oligandrum TaxID=41045 RepID=A0A8K1CA35_PYTOL|nr:hypothetical protein Poli38472_004359 [Pythium oligandrum]|eukprot:TMW59290.1 hypothetical protein Poli38472_004359 [Pythium oligandrum]
MPSFKRYEVHTLSTDFRKATKLVEEPELPVAKPGFIVVKNHYVGINATDINLTNGWYTATPPPFGCGLDAVGVVTAVGEGVQNVKVGSAVAYRKVGAFAEYADVDAATVIPVPEANPAVLSLLVCGTSASMALDITGQMKSGETVLVTAAAGGTGQFVVQLAKLAGNHVIGTTSSDEKAEVLKQLGCDRVVNYNKEKLEDVLKTEYPNGVDLVFETVGGETLKAAVKNIALYGRVILFGFISNYADEGVQDQLRFNEVGPTLLRKSASIRGFISGNHRDQYATHFRKLMELIQQGKLRPGIDAKGFVGLEQIPEALDYMYARKNIGKIAVKLV